MRRRHLALSTLATPALILPLLASSGAIASTTPKPPRPQVVVSGLNNPRQLTLAEHGALLIAEAGKGGTLATVSDPEGGTQGIGLTGSVSAVWNPSRVKNTSPHRIVTGLISAASPDGSGAVGPDGVSAYRNKVSIIETAVPPDVMVPAVVRKQSGKLFQLKEHGRLRIVADIAAYEAAHNPDGQAVDSDPYAVLQFKDYTLVADAAANDVLKVDRRGHISVWHVFGNIVNATCLDPSNQQPPPNLPGCQFVPTSLAVDRHGNVYVGGLGGLVPGQGQVVKLTGNGKHVLATMTGFTSVTGVATGKNDSLYVSQLFAPEAAPVNPAIQGVLTRISAHGKRSDLDVPFPAGVIADHRGNVYVSAFSIAPEGGLVDPASGQVVPGTSGQVWRLCW